VSAFLAGIHQFHFLRPYWLCVLALLPVLAWAWRRGRLRRSPWRGAVDAHLLPHLLEAPPARHGLAASWPALVAATFAVLALAGPSWQRTPQPLWQARAPLVLALDLSGAMLAGDLPPSRLAQARAKLASLLRERKGGQVGLLVYAGDAYVVAPLTDDAANVALFLDSLAPGIMPGDASQPSSAAPAIDRAARLLGQAGFDSGDILVLSDHADVRARVAAKSALAAGYRVSALGLGTPAGAPWRDAEGNIAHAGFDPGSLRALAGAGGGAYAPIARDDGDLAALGVLDPAVHDAVARTGETLSVWRDQGYWLLLPVLLLAISGFRRNGVFALLALCLVLPWRPAQAAGIDWWQRADQQAHARMQQGAGAYQDKDYAKAERDWQGLPGADAAYNRGNALARQGRYEDAIAAYDDALRLQPGMPDAIANRKAVEAAMKRKPPKGDRGRKGDTGDAQKPSGKDGAKPAQPAPTQQATTPGKAGAPVPRAPETDAQREGRLANQARLQRVPDDPGGLLRERFRLEHERRQQEGE
jgi:Ca-activated chloride channel family protein